MKKKIPAHWLCAILTLCWFVFTVIVCFLDSVPHQNVLINLYVAHITAQDVYYILGFILLLWILYGFIRLWKISGRVARFLLVLLGWIPIMLISFLARQECADHPEKIILYNLLLHDSLAKQKKQEKKSA